MMGKIKKLLADKEQMNELIIYVVMGILTTVVNYVVYYFCKKVLGMNGENQLIVANVIAWVVAVLFAFVTNRKYVFKSDKKGMKDIGIELGSFVAGRLVSLLIFDIAFFALFVNSFHWNDFIVKLIANVGVVIFNYVIGKFWIFKKKKG